jgi:hypothetical protein
MQLSLPVNISRPVTSKEDALRRKKHGQINGRPRRVAHGSEVVKCSVKPRKFAALERIRGKYSTTMPDIIRLAVERFVLKYGTGEGLEMPEEKQKRVAASERCHYVKIPLPPEHVRALEALVEKMGLVNRQSVVDRAITEFIGEQV